MKLDDNEVGVCDFAVLDNDASNFVVLGLELLDFGELSLGLVEVVLQSLYFVLQGR